MSRPPSETVTLAVPGAPPMQAFVARPAGAGRHPGLLVFQEAYGVNGHIRSVATRFAGEGFVAIAPEVYHRTAPPGLEVPYDRFDRAREHFSAVTAAGLEADIRAAHAWLAQDAGTDASRIAAVGYCMGGRVAYLANATVPLRASVSYYGGGIVPDLLDRAAGLQAPALFFWGGLDQHIGIEAPRRLADALRAAGKAHVHVEFSDAGHAFNCDERPSYHPVAAREAWALTRAFLAEHVEK